MNSISNIIDLPKKEEIGRYALCLSPSHSLPQSHSHPLWLARRQAGAVRGIITRIINLVFIEDTVTR